MAGSSIPSFPARLQLATVSKRPKYGAYMGLLSVGFWLIPFSTAPGDDSVVVTIGFPLILISTAYCAAVLPYQGLRFSKRDQLNLPYLIWKHKLEVLDVVEGPRISAKFFEIELHATDKSKPFFKRLARQANAKKHLTYYYLLISKVVSLVVAIRDTLQMKKS